MNKLLLLILIILVSSCEVTIDTDPTVTMPQDFGQAETIALLESIDYKQLRNQIITRFPSSVGKGKKIIYKTPSLPTWQDREWPFENGDYCIFEKIASKTDFENKEEFINTFTDSDKDDSDLNWLWEGLPETKITNLDNGTYEVSVYLFTAGGKKHCIWDAC